MSARRVATLKLENKLPDFKVKQLLRYASNDAGAFVSPFCLVKPGDPSYKTEEDFMAAKFETCVDGQEKLKKRREEVKEWMRKHKAKERAAAKQRKDALFE